MADDKRADAIASILLLLFLWQMMSAAALKSPTCDERPHIAAGLSYLANRMVELNPEHPPLLKEMSALALMIGGVRWPDDLTTQFRNRAGEDLQWSIGDKLIVENGADRVMFWARLPMVLTSLLLGFLIYAWGSQVLGKTAALCALFLFVFDPNILAHSYLVTTDTGFAAFTLLFLFTLWNYLRRPEWKRLLACGAALGAAMSSKFSGVALPAIAAILIWASWRSSAAAPAQPPVNRTPRLNPHSWRGGVLSLCAICAVAFLVIQGVYFFPADPFLYAGNYSKVYGFENPNYLHYMAGQLATHFYSYLLVAYFLKEPLPAILLALIGAGFLLRDKSLPAASKLFLFLPPVVLSLAYTISARNTGVRYLLPVLPFCFLAGGAAAARLLRAGPSWKRFLPLVLGAWLAIGSAGIYPDHLSYFNESACLLRRPALAGLDGGSRCGTLWLDDSNVDWGQGMKQLKTWIDRNALGRPIRLANFSGIPPEAYGIVYQPIDFNRDLAFPQRAWYVVSAHFVARVRAQIEPNAGYWILREPDAVVGHSYFIYDLN